ncbi:sphingosine kinase 2-like [Amphiura filiformis]|uniref:sphingosine kinase 2-like n=1 Tax=Amphiura filiformis TaxID=82378 RepID=UPI003B21DBB5
MLSVSTGSYTFEHEDGPVTLSNYRAKTGEENINILEDEFSLYPSRGTPIQVKLTAETISYEKPASALSGGDTKEVRLDIWDLAGVSCGRPKGRNGIITELNKASKTKTDSDIGAYICLYAYPYSKPPLEGGIRQKKEVVFRYSKESTYEKNLDVIQKWRVAIDLLLQNIEVNNISDIHASRLPSRPRKLLVFINPTSGRRRGEQVFNKEVAPILNQAGIQFDTVVTTRQNHAREKASEMELEKFHDGIVIVSGDGLVYEVINGLMDRKDRMKAVQVPIGVIPAGSGNAMASAILHRVGENYRKNAIMHAAFILTKPGSHPLDLISVQTDTLQVISFLAVAWGIIADIDIESERYRFLGAARFTFGAFVRIINLRHYHGKLTYLPVDDPSKYQISKSSRIYPKDNDDETIHDDDEIQRQHMTRHHSTYQMKADELPEMTARSMPRHLTVTQGLSLQGDDEFSFKDKFIREDLDSNGFTKHPSSEEGDSGVNISNGSPRELSSSTGNTSSPCLTDSSGSGEGTIETLLPALSEPVPSNWETLEGDFVGIVITYMSHLSQDVMAWPDREFDEGCLSIQYLKCPVTRKNCLDLMEAFTDGSHIEKDLVQVLYARAFRLEPMTESGILTIDGERIDYGPIQAEVIPNLKGKVLTPAPR